jgi:hypothetical protein
MSLSLLSEGRLIFPIPCYVATRIGKLPLRRQRRLTWRSQFDRLGLTVPQVLSAATT